MIDFIINQKQFSMLANDIEDLGYLESQDKDVQISIKKISSRITMHYDIDDLEFKYHIHASEDDFIAIYDYICWSGHESFGYIVSDFDKKNFQSLFKKLKEIKIQYGLKSELDDDSIENEWFMEVEIDDV